MFGMGMYELMIVGIIAIVLFGSKLPEVARSLGGSYREFRKGLGDIQSSMNEGYYSASSSYQSKPAPKAKPASAYDDYEPVSSPRFEPPPAAAREEQAGE